MNNIDMILEIVKDIRNTIHDFQIQQSEINKRVTHVEVTLEDMKNRLSTHETQLDNLYDKDKKVQGIFLLVAFCIPIVIGILEILF